MRYHWHVSHGCVPSPVVVSPPISNKMKGCRTSYFPSSAGFTGPHGRRAPGIFVLFRGVARVGLRARRRAFKRVKHCTAVCAWIRSGERLVYFWSLETGMTHDASRRRTASAAASAGTKPRVSITKGLIFHENGCVLMVHEGEGKPGRRKQHPEQRI